MRTNGRNAPTITLRDPEAARLRARADRLGTSPEGLVGAAVRQWLDAAQRDDGFDVLAERVLGKHAGLYRRLA